MNEIIDSEALIPIWENNWKDQMGDNWVRMGKSILKLIETDPDFMKPGNRNWSTVDWMIAITIANADKFDPAIENRHWYLVKMADNHLNGTISADDFNAFKEKLRVVYPYLKDWATKQLFVDGVTYYEKLDCETAVNAYAWDFDYLASKMVKYVIE